MAATLTKTTKKNLGIAAAVFLIAGAVVAVVLVFSLHTSTGACSSHLKKSSGGACVQCTHDGDCGADTLCDPDSSTCVTCIGLGSERGCPAGQACTAHHACSPTCPSGSDAECSSGVCVEAVCHPCRASADGLCPSGTFCSDKGACVECTHDYHCPSTQTCVLSTTTGGGTCAKACASGADSECPSATPTCSSGACRAGHPLSILSTEGNGSGATLYVSPDGLETSACVTSSQCHGSLSVCLKGDCTHPSEWSFTLHAPFPEGGSFGVAAKASGHLVLVTPTESALNASNATTLAATEGPAFALLMGDTARVLRTVQVLEGGVRALEASAGILNSLPRTMVLENSSGPVTSNPAPGDSVAFSFPANPAAERYLAPDFEGRRVLLSATPFYWQLRDAW